MNKRLYIWLYAGPIVGGIVILILSVLIELSTTQTSGQVSPVISVFRVIGIILLLFWLIIHTIFYFLLIAKMWGAIQDGETEISVGKAIGFLFIPFFNIYWMFKVWGGYPSEYNAYIARNNLNVPELSSGVFITVPIVILLTSFYIGLLGLPFVMIAAIMKVSDALNELENAPSTDNPYFSPPPPDSFNLNQ